MQYGQAVEEIRATMKSIEALEAQHVRLFTNSGKACHHVRSIRGAMQLP
jgi:hypothetical protein